MGDRANVLVKSSNTDRGVWLYTHWGGTELPSKLRKALAMRERWDDPAYLTRIIFDVMTEGQHGETTGFGISSQAQDGADRVLIVNCQNQTVTAGSNCWSFERFIEGEFSWG